MRAATSAPLATCLRAFGHDDAGIEDVWLAHRGLRLHLDLHRAAEEARAVVVFQPGSGSYARFYAGMASRLAASGLHVLGIDRPGHGYSEGARGDCSIEEALAVTARVATHARETFGLPVVLMGSSLGGLLTGFAAMDGVQARLPGAGHMLLHDDLDRTVPLIAQLIAEALDERV